MEEQDLADLAVFIKERTVDTAEFIDGEGGFRGDADSGQEAFDTCATCHGEDGLNNPPVGAEGEFEDFPGFIANDNPHEFLHKVRFGQPGSEMPPQADELSDSELSNLGAYAQTLPQEP